jgi:F-type H+-transporting ATPase subunit epsilon
MAIPSNIKLEIVTPDHAVAHEVVDEVQIPGADGYFGVLPGHTPLLASLQVGQLWYRKGQEKHYLSVAFGFAEVLPHTVRILADTAEKAEEIDLVRAEQERRDAEQAMRTAQAVGDLERARVSMMKALSRLQVATRARTRT